MDWGNNSYVGSSNYSVLFNQMFLIMDLTDYLTILKYAVPFLALLLLLCATQFK